MPQVSVIVPIYNEERDLARCVDSVLAQDCTDWQLVLVDDGSTDASGAMADAYAAADPRITVVHQPNKGYAGSRNAGLDQATGEWVTFLDADDYLFPQGLSAMLSYTEGTDVDYVVGGEMITYYPDERHESVTVEIKGAPDEPYWFDIAHLETAGEHIIDVSGPLFWCIWGRLYSRDIIEAHGLRFNTTQYVQEDVNWTLTYFYYMDKGVVIPELVYDYSREEDKDDVGWRPLIDQHRSCCPSLQSFERLAFKHGYSEEYVATMRWRLAQQYLNIAAKLYQPETPLTEEGRKEHVFALTEEYPFQVYSRTLGVRDPFWADCGQLLDNNDLLGIYDRLALKVEEDQLPMRGAANIR